MNHQRRQPFVHNVHKMKRPPAETGGRLAWSGPISLVAGTGFEPATSGLGANRLPSRIVPPVSHMQFRTYRSSRPLHRIPRNLGCCAAFCSQIRSHHLAPTRTTGQRALIPRPPTDPTTRRRGLHPLDPHEPLSEVGQDRRNNCQPSAEVAQAEARRAGLEPPTNGL